MAITGTIQADYSKFVEECKKAATGLDAIEKQAGETGTALADMETKVATGKLDAAISKTVASVDKAGASAKASASNFGVMADGLRTADRTLAQFGVNLGPTIGSLDEFAKVSGKTAGDLGKLGTAASVAGAALAGWNIGRWIAEMTGSDKIIGDATAKLLGWNDASQVGANNAAVLQRAFQLTGQVFTDVHAASEAIRKSLQSNAAQFTTSETLIKGWSKELSNAKGGVAALKTEIDAGNLTTDEMTKRFGVSARAIEYLTGEMRKGKDAAKEHQAALDEAAKKAQQEADAITKLRESMFGTDTIGKAQQYVAALGSVENLTRMSKDATVAMHTELGKAIEAYTRMGQVAPQTLRDIYTATLPLPPIVEGLGSEWANVGEKVTVSADSIIADMKRLQQETKDYEAETQRMAEAFSESQKAVDKGGQSMDRTAQSARGLVVEMNAVAQAGIHVRDAWEEIAAGNYLMEQYAKTGVAMGQQIATGGYTFQQLKDVGVKPTYGLAQPLDTTTPWGNQNTLNVNVNSTDAQDIAGKLVTEMKRSGYRL